MSDRYSELHDRMMEEARSVGLDHVLQTHDRYRSAPQLPHSKSVTVGAHQATRFTPAYWSKWQKQIQKMDNRPVVCSQKFLDSSADRADAHTTSYPAAGVQDTSRPRKRFATPLYHTPNESTNVLSRFARSTAPLLELDPAVCSRVRGSYAIANMTSRDSSRLNTAMLSCSSPSTTPDTLHSMSRRTPSGRFAKEKRFTLQASHQQSFSLPHIPQHSATVSLVDNIHPPVALNKAAGKFGDSGRFCGFFGESNTPSNSLGPGSYQIPRMFDGKNPREERFSELLIRFKEEDERRSRGMLEAIPRANRSEPNWLHDAVLRGDLPTIHVRTKDPSANIDINLNDTLEPHRHTALHLAALRGYLPIAQHLLRELLPGFQRPKMTTSRPTRRVEQIDIDMQDARGDTALHIASRQGDADMVTLLSEAGANLGLLNSDGRDPEGVARSSQVRQELALTRQLRALRLQLETLRSRPTPSSGSESNQDLGCPQTGDEELPHVLSDDDAMMMEIKPRSSHSYYIGHDNHPSVVDTSPSAVDTS